MYADITGGVIIDTRWFIRILRAALNLAFLVFSTVVLNFSI